MRKSSIKYALWTLAAIILSQCSSVENVNIPGVYQIDKTVIRDSTIKNIKYSFLILEADHNFKLRNMDNIGSISGKWKDVKSTGNRQRVIQFNFENRQIHAELNGNIIYFKYPDDFHSGLYESVLYVKTSHTLDEITRPGTY